MLVCYVSQKVLWLLVFSSHILQNKINNKLYFSCISLFVFFTNIICLNLTVENVTRFIQRGNILPDAIRQALIRCFCVSLLAFQYHNSAFYCLCMCFVKVIRCIQFGNMTVSIKLRYRA